MKTLEVTQLEKKVLEALADEMYAEEGFSDVGIREMKDATKLSPKVLRGVASSLIKKGLLDVDFQEFMTSKNQKLTLEKNYYWYLCGDAKGLVNHWVDNDRIVPIQLIVK